VPDAQSQWAELLLATLAEAGIRDAIISPGSRSTPLVWAACQIPSLRRHALIDERSAGFFALGQARVTGAPSLLICTSGTAPSHYYPAVIEARQSGLPLLVLSADRPFELQDCGASQTIDQAHLFGGYARYFELGTPVAERAAVLGLQRMAWQAVAAALEAPRGAVHLNFRAKKPLEPASLITSEVTPVLRPARSGYRWRPAPPTQVSPEDLAELTERWTQSRCPLLVCGALSLQDSPSAELVARFARLSGAIVCAESVSQLRFQLDPSTADVAICDSYDWLLGSPQWSKQVAPDLVLQLGAPPLSAQLGRLLEDTPGLELWVCAETGWPDPLLQSARITRACPTELLLALCRALEARSPAVPSTAQRLWRDAGTRVRQLVDAQLGRAFGEPEAVSRICSRVPAGSLLVLGNSLPPRLVDRYCPAAARRLRVLSQRGTSGIEGLIAGALGAASQAQCPTTLLCGDISFLHDVGSLWAARSEHTHVPATGWPLVIVVINNGGGRIFDQLPMAKQAGDHQRFWTTPHALDLRGAAALYEVGYSRASDRETLRIALESAYARTDVSIVEVVVDADSARARLSAVAAEVDTYLRGVLSAS
jgi:2-succinyl-5-enolpyruvyl-6-hydroxy-3-cyclohexene-1-carboxylate synthase